MRKLAIAVALSSTVLATPALARNGAWYVGGDFGAMIVEDMGFDFGTAPRRYRAPVATAQIGINHEYGYDGALFVGYDLGAFRLEAEVAYKSARVDDIETTIRLPGFGGGPVGGVVTPTIIPAGGGRSSALSFMINGMLDFGDDDGISGFVGGGVGIARVDLNNIRAFSNQARFVDDCDTRFAWQVVAGVRQAISDNIDVTVRYRFFNADNIRIVDFRGVEAESRFRSHSLLGGITFNFGAPAAAAAAPAAVPGWLEPRRVGVCVAPPPPPPPPAKDCPNGSRHPGDRQVPGPAAASVRSLSSSTGTRTRSLRRLPRSSTTRLLPMRRRGQAQVIARRSRRPFRFGRLQRWPVAASCQQCPLLPGRPRRSRRVDHHRSVRREPAAGRHRRRCPRAAEPARGNHLRTRLRLVRRASAASAADCYQEIGAGLRAGPFSLARCGEGSCRGLSSSPDLRKSLFPCPSQRL